MKKTLEGTLSIESRYGSLRDSCIDDYLIDTGKTWFDKFSNKYYPDKINILNIFTDFRGKEIKITVEEEGDI